MHRNATLHVRSWETPRLLVEGNRCSWPLTQSPILHYRHNFQLPFSHWYWCGSQCFTYYISWTSTTIRLVAVNGASILTFGKCSLTLNLGLRRTFRWVFVIANVHIPIIGADFLHHYSLVVDMTNSWLVDSITQLRVQEILSHVESLRPSFFPSQHTTFTA